MTNPLSASMGILLIDPFLALHCCKVAWQKVFLKKIQFYYFNYLDFSCYEFRNLKLISMVCPGVVFDLFGYNAASGSAGFIKEFGIKSELPPQFAQMISAAGAARQRVVGEDATTNGFLMDDEAYHRRDHSVSFRV